MHKLSQFVIFSLAVVTQCHGYVFQVLPSPDHPNECFHPTTNVTMQPGDVYYALEQCEEYRCSAGGFISGTGCSSFATPPNCEYVGPDYTKQYPDCCATVKCESSEKIDSEV